MIVVRKSAQMPDIVLVFSNFGEGRVWDWGLNLGLCSCNAGTLPLEPDLQSILLWLFFGDGVL
jgi:hypothetical protein